MAPCLAIFQVVCGQLLISQTSESMLTEITILAKKLATFWYTDVWKADDSIDG